MDIIKLLLGTLAFFAVMFVLSYLLDWATKRGFTGTDFLIITILSICLIAAYHTIDELSSFE